MAKNLGQIFWGMLLVILDFKIEQIDFLPDVLGYVLVAIGCSGMAGSSPQFRTAGRLSLVLSAFSILELFVRGDAVILCSILTTICDCAMIWALLGGIIQYVSGHERPDIAQQASNRRIAYVTLQVIGTVLGLSSPPRDVAEVLALLLIILMFTLVFMILHLIRKVRREVALQSG